ncbi:MAG TPA: SusF/SusE family outer membrane protein [Hanamia sp.]|nr:SusF/SusE family outer membrane protein [Hanamia sp.]
MEFNDINLRSAKPKSFLAKGIFILVSGLFFLACKKTGIVIPEAVNAPLAISATDSVLVLNQANQNNTAVTFNWTTGTNNGSNSAISYTFQLDKKGDNFAKPISIDLGKQVYNLNYTTGQLNDSLLNHWNITPGTVANFEARIIANVSGSTSEPQISNVKEIAVTPYQPVSSTLYIIGGATPTGWDNNKSEALETDPLNPGGFIYQGTLLPGSFKFITTLGSFLPSYNMGADSSKLFYRTSDDQPDDQFTINEASVYKVTVNLIGLTIKVEKLAQAPYSKLWIIGDAVPKGWNISTPDSMFRNPNNAFIFKYNQVLNAGEFKIPTAATGDFGVPFYMPLTNHPDLSQTGVQLVQSGGDDLKWNITNPGPYKITLDLLDMSIHIVPFQPYKKLWIVGDATPNGWNIDAPSEMTATSDPNVFTYSGHLNVGEFKFPVATGDWGTDFFRPYKNHPDISDTNAQFVKHGTAPDDTDDYKWYIPVAGNYTITLNQLYETISIVKQ